MCPCHIPLVQYYRYAKTQIAAEERKRDGADHAKQRFLQRQQRLERDKQEEQGLATTESALSDSVETATDTRKSYIDAAVARTREKRRRLQQSDEGDKDE